MKAKVFIFLTLLCTLILLILFITNPLDKLAVRSTIGEETEEKEKALITLTFIITEVNGDDYYGQSIDGNTKIYFNRKNVKYPINESIKINDKILAYVESENHVDGIVKIEKIN